MFRRWGLSPKYEHAGIYCIKVDDRIVYVGKSINMLRRISEHYVGIKTGKDTKGRILAEVQHKGHPISFDVLYDAKRENKAEIEEEIGAKEAEYIR